MSDSIKVAVLETRLDNIENSLNEHKKDFREFVKSNDYKFKDLSSRNDNAHNEVRKDIVQLQRVLYGAVGILGFLTFMFQAVPFINTMYNQSTPIEIRDSHTP